MNVAGKDYHGDSDEGTAKESKVKEDNNDKTDKINIEMGLTTPRTHKCQDQDEGGIAKPSIPSPRKTEAQRFSAKRKAAAARELPSQRGFDSLAKHGDAVGNF